MKRKTLIWLLCCMALLTAGLTVLTKRVPGVFSSVVTFPLEQAAQGLRLLSESGRVGNGIAAALWAGIAAVPVLAALRMRRVRETRPERTALAVLSAAVLLALYGMVNPQVFLPARVTGDADFEKVFKAMLGVTVWSCAVLWAVTRIIRLVRGGSREQLLGYLRSILYVLCFVIAASAAVSGTGGALALAGEGMTGADRFAGVTAVAAQLVTALFEIAVTMRAIGLLRTAEDENGERLSAAAEGMNKACCRALAVTAAVTVLQNLIRIAAMPWLTDSTVTAVIPVTGIAFLVIALLFSRLLTENRSLRDDNSLFI